MSDKASATVYEKEILFITLNLEVNDIKHSSFVTAILGNRDSVFVPGCHLLANQISSVNTVLLLARKK